MVVTPNYCQIENPLDFSLNSEDQAFTNSLLLRIGHDHITEKIIDYFYRDEQGVWSDILG